MAVGVTVRASAGPPHASHATLAARRQAALKCLYLVTRSLDPTGQGKARWAMRWKPALNAFAITFGDRFPAAETY
jgi:transposase-like protein